MSKIDVTESHNTVSEIAKAITKFFKDLFGRKGMGSENGFITLDNLQKNLVNYLDNNSDKKSPLRKWVNENAKDFMEKVHNFGVENNEKLVELCKAGKYGEMHKLIIDSVAKDIGFEMESREMPDDIKSDPNRRMPHVTADAVSDVSSLAENMDENALVDSMDLIKKDAEKHLSQPSQSQHEKDNNLDYDKSFSKSNDNSMEQTMESSNEMDM